MNCLRLGGIAPDYPSQITRLQKHTLLGEKNGVIKLLRCEYGADDCVLGEMVWIWGVLSGCFEYDVDTQ